MQLDGKVAIVTGSGNGLGVEYAKALAAEGASVVVADVEGADAERVAKEIEADGGRAIGVQVDTADDASVEAMAARAVEAFGGVDILVNNAGWRPNPAGHHYDDLPQDPNSTEVWRKVLAVNVLGPMICARTVRPIMKARGGGVIVNQSSNSAYMSGAGAYGVSKSAVNGLTLTLAIEYEPDGIRVNGIAPGMMTGRLPADVVEYMVNQQILKRRGTPHDLVGALIFLCTDASSFITGQTIVVDGGQIKRH
jgi:3-oxoacyl-[acyl-carrier protein] reductase